MAGTAQGLHHAGEGLTRAQSGTRRSQIRSR